MARKQLLNELRGHLLRTLEALPDEDPWSGALEEIATCIEGELTDEEAG